MENKNIVPIVRLPEPDDITMLLDNAVKYYHKKLLSNKKAIEYLKARGINEDIIEEFKLGFCDGTLKTIMSGEQKETLHKAGFFRDKVGEHLLNCITVPLTDSTGKTVNIHGHKINNFGYKYLYLKTEQKGLFNIKAYKLSGIKEIIITENIIDALSIISRGILNTVSLYDDYLLQGELINLIKTNRIKTVVLALSSSKLSIKESGRLHEELLKHDLSVKVIYPPEGKSWRKSSGLVKKDILKIISDTRGNENKKEEPELDVRKEGNIYFFKINNITYRLAGLKDMFVSSLRLNIKTKYKNTSFYDTIDLYSHRGRENYSHKLSRVTEIEPRIIEKDLIRILEYLEDMRDRRLGESSDKSAPLTEDEKISGLKFLSSPDIFLQIDRDMTELGYVSESENKLIVYLAAVSRYLPNPLNVYIQADSAGGKSALLNTLEKMLPPDDVWKAFTISTQALHYVEEDKFLDKVFMMGESIHDDVIEALVRQMQSEGEISRLVTVKDEKTGELRARLIKKKVRMSFMVTSTALFMNPENASRCLMIYADESEAQTERVQKNLGISHDFKGKIVNAHKAERIIKKHVSAQKLLEKINVFNPLWKYIKFPKKRPSMRRIFDQFLTLIDSVCFLRQKQKKIIRKVHPHTKEEVTGIECDIKDYETAYNLFTKAVLKRGGYDIPQGTRHLYESIRTMVRKLAKSKKIDTSDVTFISKQVREYTQLGAEFVKKHLRILVDFEYIELAGDRRKGVRYLYRLRADVPIEELDISMIPEPAALKKQMNKG